MPHAIRPLAAGLTLHITAHATGQRQCFPDEGARSAFRGALCELVGRMSVDLHAFAMMDNHLHLLLTARADAASADLMRCALSNHALAINRTTGYRGSLWRDRHQSVLVSSDIQVLHTCLFIDANPWRAGQVDHPLASGWTSHRELALGEEAGFLTPHPMLRNLRPGADWRPRYQEIMAEYLRRGTRASFSGCARSPADPLGGLRLRSWAG